MPDLFVANHDNQPETLKIEEKPEEEKPIVPQPPEKAGDEKSREIGLFQTFCERPDGIKFKNQEDEEKILLFLRRRILTNFPWIARAGIMAAVPFIIVIVSAIFNLPLDFLPSRYISFILLFYYAIIILYLYINFLTWFYTVDMVTPTRIIDVDFKGILVKHIAETKLQQVEDVSYMQVGVLRSIFNYGNVSVQTAGTIENFEFTAVPDPDRVVSIIEALIKGDQNP